MSLRAKLAESFVQKWNVGRIRVPKIEISNFSSLDLFQYWKLGMLKGPDESNTALKFFGHCSFCFIVIKDSISMLQHPLTAKVPLLEQFRINNK